MIKNKKLIYVLLILFLGVHESALSGDENITNSVKTSLHGFVKLLDKDYQPTLSDYQQYFGYSDIEELQFQWAYCQKDGQTPYLRDKDCHHRTIKAWQKKAETPSAYLAWIRSLLPANPKAKLVKIEQSSLSESYAGSNIYVDLDGIPVQFWQPEKPYQAVTGEFSLVSIKGVPLDQYRKMQENASVLIALGMTDLVRPLTKEEAASRKAARIKKCEKDPRCAKSMAQGKANRKFEKLVKSTSESVEKTFANWCEKNKALCKEHRSRLAEMDRKIYQYRDKCGDDYKACVSVLLDLHKKKKTATRAFCKSNKNECDMMASVRLKRYERDATWCRENSARCNKVKSPFDKALLEVYGTMYKKNNIGG